jgi:hypothetical protein
MTPHDGTTWISPRDPALRATLDAATFTAADGIRYLRPELVLAFKARRLRNDDADFEAALPLLDERARAALHAAVERADPDHPWLARL